MKTNSISTSNVKAEKSRKASAPVKKAPVANTERQSAGARTETLPAHAKSTKLQRCLTILGTSDGATIDELMTATGWQAHSVRGFLAGTVKKKLGLTLESTKADDGARRYRVISVQG